MGEAERNARLQALLADALLAPDPVALLRGHPEPELAAIDAAGLRLAALLVVKLRFQRLLNASREAAAWFERDAEGFTRAFRDYHQTVPPVALDPWGEAAAFARRSQR
ncbi:MAG: hypothetical protein JNN13_08130 [Planctomycetes bacterium]|nr:hypothetical protein [Planctomycetota bacterium]